MFSGCHRLRLALQENGPLGDKKCHNNLGCAYIYARYMAISDVYAVMDIVWPSRHLDGRKGVLISVVPSFLGLMCVQKKLGWDGDCPY